MKNMKKISELVLRKKWLIISAGITFTAIPVITLAAFMYSITTKALETKIMEENKLVALMCANGLEGRLRRDMVFAASPYLLSGMKKGNIKELQRHLGNLVLHSGDVEKAFITSPKGALLAGYPSASPERWKNFSNTDWYKGVSKSRRPYVSDFNMNMTKPTGYFFTMAIPMINPSTKRILGILVMQKGEGYIRNALADMSMTCSQVYIFDKQGNLIYHPKYALDRVINCSHSGCVQRAIKGDKGAEKTLDPLTKEPVLAAYHPVSVRGWSIVVTRHESDVFAPVKRITLWIAVFTFIMLFGGGFFALKGAELLNSTRELAVSLSEGQHAQRVYDDFLTLLNHEWTDTTDLCNASIEKLREHIGANAGIFYVFENNRLEPYSTFGIESPAFVSALSYECLGRRKIIRVKGISPDTALNLKTEGGGIRPADIITIPLMYQEKVMGVLELGSIDGFSGSNIKSLEQIAPQLAVGINTLKTYLAQKALSKKVQASDEELEVMNKELSAKSEKIEILQKELKEISAKLREASPAKTDLLTNMNHEVRTQLNSIIGFTDAFRRGGKKKERLAIVIDNDPNAVKIVEAALISEGYKVIKSSSGKEGIEVAKTRNPDLIVLDLMMPEINGFETVDLLRSHDKTSDVRIVALTSIVLSPENRRRLEGKVENITEKNKLTRSGFIAEIRRISDK